MNRYSVQFSFLTLVLPYDLGLGVLKVKPQVLKSLLKDNSKAALKEYWRLYLGFLFRVYPPERQQKYTALQSSCNTFFENTVFRKNGSLPNFKIQSFLLKVLCLIWFSKSKKQRQGDIKSIHEKHQDREKLIQFFTKKITKIKVK